MIVAVLTIIVADPSVSAAPSSSSSSSSNNLYIIVGAAVGGAVLVTLIIAVAITRRSQSAVVTQHNPNDVVFYNAAFNNTFKTVTDSRLSNPAYRDGTSLYLVGAEPENQPEYDQINMMAPHPQYGMVQDA